MIRKCEECGHSVEIGQGKWIKNAGGSKASNLVHKALALCVKAESSSRNRRQAIATALKSQGEASQMALAEQKPSITP